jgi:hypothetical protein
MLIIHFTAGQVESLRLAFEHVLAMSDDGMPGMCVAQIYGDHMVVGVLDHERAKLLQQVLDNNAPPRYSTSAYDRESSVQ